jgi:hypothetical protein
MRKLQVLVFLVAGILQGLLFLDEFRYHVSNGDATHYVFMALFAIGSIACLRAGRADWREGRQPSDERSHFGRH